MLQNTIVANSAAGGNCSGAITDSGGNLSYPDNTCPGINSDPVLGPLQNNGGPTHTMALGPGSAALDAADDAICAPAPVNNLDQRGAPRVGRCDIGAYEAGLFATKQVAGSFEPGGTVTYTISLRNLQGKVDLLDVILTDTLSVPLAYVPGSFTATGGAGGESHGVIAWNGIVHGNAQVLISFSAKIIEIASRGIITNTAVSTWRTAIAVGEATFDTFVRTYLPHVTRK